uniref:DEAD-box helicase OB fold domain-containing protein n=1 Tax=Ditylenchus dipsaci TaxID=166011 RepID=A0A915CLW2_9BILA
MKLVHFPVEPSHAKILVSANPLNCIEEALTNEFLSGGSNGESSSYASSSKRYFMDEGDSSRKFDASEGDHVRMIKIYRAYKSQVKNNKNNLKEWCSTNGLNPRRLENVSNCGADFTPLRKAICQGLFINACVYDVSTATYRLERKMNVGVKIHPSSCLARRSAIAAFVFTDLVQTTDMYARDVCLVDPDWLKTIREALKKEKKFKVSWLDRELLFRLLERDQMDVCFKNPNFPASALNEENIMAYFCDPANPFYHRQSDNETLRMQNININRMAMEEMLKKMNGIQYVLVTASPPLFVICKQQRNTLNSVAPLFSTGRCFGSLRNALGQTLDSLKFNASRGSAEMEEDQNESDSASTASMARDEEKSNNNPSRDRATAFQRTRTDMLLKALVDQFPPQNMASESASRNQEDSISSKD